MSTSLEVRDLTRHHRGQQTPALNGLELAVDAGTCLAVLGPSGSGKSTALRLIAGLDAPTRGAVFLDGEDVTNTPAEKRGIAMVFQRPLLFPHLSVIDNVAFAARAAGLSRRDSRSASRRYLEFVQLGDYADRSVADISGGQAQRVALARSLAAEPKVLLLDEPFSALDSALRSDMYALLRSIRDELNPTIVLVTHDQSEAAVVADAIAVLISGTMEHHSDMRTAYVRPSTLAVHRLMGGLNEIHGSVASGVHHSELGSHALPAGVCVRDGPATLMIRQEMVRIVPATAPAVTGTIVQLQSVGIRQRARVRIGTSSVFVDLAPHVDVMVGAEVGLELPTEALQAVSDES
ncbi:MAG: ABC transporter ATP-binding protein [Mycolicibacterium sp.]|uniref:ABC transporter ATP-binding protein n=1 Tax=Mycolicibacterium sp. TaxID=2320850 RepID=UPI003D0B7863